jgi:hypothetical protein
VNKRDNFIISYNTTEEEEFVPENLKKKRLVNALFVLAMVAAGFAFAAHLIIKKYYLSATFKNHAITIMQTITSTAPEAGTVQVAAIIPSGFGVQLSKVTINHFGPEKAELAIASINVTPSLLALLFKFEMTLDFKLYLSSQKDPTIQGKIHIPVKDLARGIENFSLSKIKKMTLIWNSFPLRLIGWIIPRDPGLSPSRVLSLPMHASLSGSFAFHSHGSDRFTYALQSEFSGASFSVFELERKLKALGTNSVVSVRSALASLKKSKLTVSILKMTGNERQMIITPPVKIAIGSGSSMELSGSAQVAASPRYDLTATLAGSAVHTLIFAAMLGCSEKPVSLSYVIRGTLEDHRCSVQ